MRLRGSMHHALKGPKTVLATVFRRQKSLSPACRSTRIASDRVLQQTGQEWPPGVSIRLFRSCQYTTRQEASARTFPATLSSGPSATNPLPVSFA